MNRKWFLLLSPDEAGSAAVTGEGAATGGEQTQEEAVFTPSGEEGEEGAGEGEGAATATTTETAKPSGLSKDDITEILKGAMGERQPAAAESQAKPPTEEELEKMFNVWKPSNELLAQLRSEKPEDALKALTAMRDGLLRQSMTMAEYRVKAMMNELQETQIAPIASYVSEQQAMSFRSDFFKQNPDLEKYEPLVDAVAAKLKAAGYEGKSRSDVMKKFAEETRTVVKSLLAKGEGANTQTPSGGQATNGAVRKMSTLTGGGHGGGGRPAAGGTKAPAGMEVFE